MLYKDMFACRNVSLIEVGKWWVNSYGHNHAVTSRRLLNDELWHHNCFCHEGFVCDKMYKRYYIFNTVHFSIIINEKPTKCTNDIFFFFQFVAPTWFGHFWPSSGCAVTEYSNSMICAFVQDTFIYTYVIHHIVHVLLHRTFKTSLHNFLNF